MGLEEVQDLLGRLGVSKVHLLKGQETQVTEQARR